MIVSGITNLKAAKSASSHFRRRSILSKVSYDTFRRAYRIDIHAPTHWSPETAIARLEETLPQSAHCYISCE